MQFSLLDLLSLGYIDPIQDPLNLKIELGREVKWSDLCESNGTPTEKGKLDQAAVEEWYAKWVTELIRIAKPGKIVIVEQVSLPSCIQKSDWGGVSVTWWNAAAEKYGWNIDANSIITKKIESESFQSQRYNVYMKKEK